MSIVDPRGKEGGPTLEPLWACAFAFWKAFQPVLTAAFVFVFQSDGNTAFLRAARAGNLDKVLEHLKSDVDINTANAVSARVFAYLAASSSPGGSVNHTL